MIDADQAGHPHFHPVARAGGTRVTIQGRGFSTVPAENRVAFNGTSATVVSATSTGLVVRVPAGATTGLLAVTVAGKTVVTDQDFAVLPGITALQPTLALARSVMLALHVRGSNLTGATFTFTPTVLPPDLTITAATIDPTGNSATLQVSVDARTTGAFVLVATTAAGISRGTSTVANTLQVLQDGTAHTDGDGLSNGNELARGTNPFQVDMDGDGFIDGEEVAFGSDPSDKHRTKRQSATV